MTDVISSITTALGTVSTNFATAMGDVVPIALGIMGLYLVIRLVIRAFKGLSK